MVASTDGAAIFALLRGSTLRRKLARTLEGEAGLNDPVAVLLVVGFIDWIQHPGYGLADMAGLFAFQVGIGLAIGIGVGWLAVQAFRRVRLATAGLYPVAAIATAALAYGGAATLDGSGFLAVYLAGLMLGSAAIPARQAIVEQLRIRRDAPGGLWGLGDGRYAVTGPLAAVGPHAALTRWAVRRLAVAGPDERAWLRTVIGAIAADRHRPHQPSQGPASP